MFVLWWLLGLAILTAELLFAIYNLIKHFKLLGTLA